MADYVELKKIDEFRDVLRDYAISDHAKAILAKTELVILFGVFASGRNSIINQLVRGGKYHFIISDTTRPPKVRDGSLEQDGVQYHFRSEDQVLADLKNGEFLEAELIHNQQVSGISIRELERAMNSGKIAINEVDIEGARTIMSVKPDTKLVFVVPPSYQEWIRRIKGREEMTEIEFNNRTRSAQAILQTALRDDRLFFVINDDINHAVRAIDDVAHAGVHSQEHSDRAKAAAKELLSETSRYLSTLD